MTASLNVTVIGIELMFVGLPTGEVIQTPLVPQHASGPDFFRLFLGAEGTFGIITKATMQLDYIPETRLLRAVLFDDLGKALEAGRQIMTKRLTPFVIRLYDPDSTRSRVRKILGYELDGAYMVLGFDKNLPNHAFLLTQRSEQLYIMGFEFCSFWFIQAIPIIFNWNAHIFFVNLAVLIGHLEKQQVG